MGNRHFSPRRRASLHGKRPGAEPRDGCHNPYIADYEKYVLCRLLLHGKEYEYDFSDKRHETIYSCLKILRGQIHNPSVDELIRYLAEYHLLGRAGGERYVKAVFQGL
jgi:hypothetical protein